MKITLGIDFNITRTVICSYSEQKRAPIVCYNQPSVGYISNTMGSFSTFGDDCLNKDFRGRNLRFYPTIVGQNENILSVYFEKVLMEVFKGMKEANIEVDNIIFSTTNDDLTLKRVFKSLSNKFREIKDSKLIFNNKTDLLNISLIHNISKVNKISTTNLVLLNLGDFSYDYSVIKYKVGESTPTKLATDNLNISMTSPSPFGDYGSFAFCRLMLENSIDSQEAVVRAYLKDEQNQLIKYKCILDLVDFLVKNKDYFYQSESPASRKIKINIDNQEYQISITKKDYDAAVEKVIYGNRDSIRQFLMRVKEILPVSTYSVMCYGTAASIIDVQGLIASIFGYKAIIKNEMLFQSVPLSHRDYIYIAQGAALQSSLSYKGVIPKISFRNYKGIEQTILSGNEQLLAQSSIYGQNYYAFNKEFSLPLHIRLSQEELNEQKAIIIVDGKEYNLYDYIYKNGYLNARNSFDKKENIILVGLKLGLINRKGKPNVLVNCFSNKTGLAIEFELGREV